jgi:7-carboxy-7-deazaguanine synthase
MRISEIFHSLQGEGVLVGTPSVFVRSSGCNLRCVWCDTPYTSWAPEGDELSVDAILSRVLACHAKHVVVTGGEPMIAPDIVPLTEALREAGLHITIETAGTVWANVACDLMSLSPKLANSTPLTRDGGRWASTHERLRYQPEVLRRLTQAYDYQMKFVVERAEDLAEIKAVVVETGAASERVVLMSEGTDAETLRERGRWIAEICKQEGYRYTPRLHVELWGARRGV